ncbi:unnamed protein product, partial [marine sediment metagenome]
AAYIQNYKGEPLSGFYFTIGTNISTISGRNGLVTFHVVGLSDGNTHNVTVSTSSTTNYQTVEVMYTSLYNTMVVYVDYGSI